MCLLYPTLHTKLLNTSQSLVVVINNIVTQNKNYHQYNIDQGLYAKRE